MGKITKADDERKAKAIEFLVSLTSNRPSTVAVDDNIRNCVRNWVAEGKSVPGIRQLMNGSVALPDHLGRPTFGLWDDETTAALIASV